MFWSMWRTRMMASSSTTRGRHKCIHLLMALALMDRRAKGKAHSMHRP